MKTRVCVTVGLAVVLSLVLAVGVTAEEIESEVNGDSQDTGPVDSQVLQDESNNNTDSAKPDASSGSENCNGSDCKSAITGFKDAFMKNRGMLMRTLYVLVAVTGVIVLYFVVRTIRIRRRKSKTKKYGVITPASDMEMTPLDQDDDDEDMTVFEVNGIPK